MRKSSNIALFAITILGLGISSLDNRALAQTETPQAAETGQQAGALQEVVVTARRRSESLQNAPVTVTPITQAEIQNNDATDLSKIGELAPQVLIGVTATGTGAILGIRGISSGATDSGVDQSVSVDIDGVQLSRGRIVLATMFDLEGVQVLPGPQALFFGKNSPAGVIQISTADPTGDFEAAVKAGYEFEASERYAEAFMSGAVTDTLLARFAFRADYMEGWIKDIAVPMQDPLNPAAEEQGATSQSESPRGYDFAGRLTLLWTPWDNFDAKFKLTLDKNTGNGNNENSEPYCIDGTTVPMELGIPQPRVNCQKDMVKANSAPAALYMINYPNAEGGIPYTITNLALGSLSLNEKLNGVSLISTTGMYFQNLGDSAANDESQLAQIFDTEVERYKLITQELRANTTLNFPVNFTGGVYFEHSDRSLFNSPMIFPAFTGFNTTADNWTTNEMHSDETGDTYSAFAEAHWDIIPTVELAAGARYSYVKSDMTIQNVSDNPGSINVGIPLLPVNDILLPHYTDHNVSPQVTLSWHPEADETVYAAYKTGYKPGGISNGPLFYTYTTADSLLYGHETTKGAEIGYKADLLDRKVRLDLTAYDYNYDGLQVTSVNNQHIIGDFTISNAAAATTRGLEAEAKWLVTDELTFSGNVGYNRARYKDFPGAACYEGQTAALGCNLANSTQNLAGQPLVRAPNLTYDLAGDYRVKWIPGWTTDLALDGAYSSSYQTAGDSNPGGVQPSFWRLNAAVHLISDDSHYEFSFIGRDLTNSYYMLASNGAPGGLPTQLDAFFNRPRELILEMRYHYGR